MAIHFWRMIRHVLLGWAVLAASPIVAAQAQTIWFAPRAPFPPANRPGAVDLMDLFQPGAPWKGAASYVQVFLLPTMFLAWVPDDQLATIVQDLNRRGIALAMASLAQSVVGQPQCGHNVEGYGDPGMAQTIADKIKRVGGKLSFVAMDEPLFFGHFFNSPFACHSTVDNVAERVAAVVSRYRAVFPDVRVGDIEPAGATLFPGWDITFDAWVGAFQKAVGTPLAFLQIDADWNNPNHVEGIRRSAEIAARNRLPVGMIYDGKDNDTSDRQWITSAKANIIAAESILGRRPDQAIFETWVAHPSRVLPETDADSLTGLVNYYVRSRNVEH
jgi:hypothetical protein